MKTKLITYTLLLFLCSCSIKKEATKKKVDIVEKKDFISESFRTITERFEGEQLNTDVLPISMRKRDGMG